jgi:hypothetical protein
MEMFALKVRQSGDSRLVGEPISAVDYKEIESLIESAGGVKTPTNPDGVDMPKLLAFAAADKMENIRSGKLPQLRAILKKKAKTAKPSAPTKPLPISSPDAVPPADWKPSDGEIVDPDTGEVLTGPV